MLKQILKLGWTSFSRSKELVVATIFILVVTIFLITSLFFLSEISQFLIANLQQKVDISVYFKETASPEQILTLKEELAEISEVKEVEYVSREEALEKFKARHQEDPIILQSLAEIGVNPLLASLNIKAWQPDQYQTISSFLSASNFEDLIKKTDYFQRKPVIEKISSLTAGISRAGIIFSLILAIISILVVFNTIRLAIYNSKEEIKIQRLVGASNWFIRGPFLVQGVISGFFAALISLLIFTLTSWIFSPKLETALSGFNLFGYFAGNFWTLLLIQLVIGIGLGVISSLIATRKYLET